MLFTSIMPTHQRSGRCYQLEMKEERCQSLVSVSGDQPVISPKSNPGHAKNLECLVPKICLPLPLSFPSPLSLSLSFLRMSQRRCIIPSLARDDDLYLRAKFLVLILLSPPNCFKLGEEENAGQQFRPRTSIWLDAQRKKDSLFLSSFLMCAGGHFLINRKA